MLFTDEIENMNELIQKLSNYDLGTDKVKVAVVCFIFDENNNLILHRRGPGARDEIGKLQAIGGSVNNEDISFRDSLHRELVEETGSEAKIEIGEFIGAQLDGKVDKHTNEFVNWIILAYKGTLVSGNLINAEPDRCVGFEKDKMENFKEDDVSTTARNFINYLIKKDSLQ